MLVALHAHLHCTTVACRPVSVWILQVPLQVRMQHVLQLLQLRALLLALLLLLLLLELLIVVVLLLLLVQGYHH
jgi:hypothetical protein